MRTYSRVYEIDRTISVMGSNHVTFFLKRKREKWKISLLKL